MKKILLLASAAMITPAMTFVAAPAAAQEVTTSVQGVVTSETGDPVPAATVTLIDTRTGRSSTITTSNVGTFSFRNLEVGGPFTVVAKADGFQSERAEGITASLGDGADLYFALASANDTTEEEIVVTAASVNAGPRAMGPGSSYGLATLNEQPSSTRDIRDVVQNDPRVLLDSSFPDSGSNRGTVSCLGASTRVNSLTVDGVRQDDGFGLNDSGFPSESQPFPFEALSSVSVEFAPYDVQYGLFSGCNINAVTKSGTNEFHGGAFFYYNDDSMVGDKIDGNDITIGEFDTKKYGAYVGGPILKDRLFFHVTYDKEDGSEGLSDGPAGSGLANEASRITAGEISEVQSILQSVYGFDAGGFLANIPRSTERVLARIDANITDNHRAAFNYQRTREDFVTPQNTNARFNELGLSSNYYQSGNTIDSYSLRLFSNWTDALSTELRFSRIENKDQQDSLGGTDFMQFEVVTPSGGSIFLGPDSFRQANDLRTTTDQAKLAATYAAGAHTITAGVEYDNFDVYNLFIQDGNGTALFDSFDDLRNQTPSDFTYRGAVSGNQDDAAAIFDRSIYSFYIQDEFRPTSALTIQGGVRYDVYDSNDVPVANPLFANRYGFTNAKGFDGLSAFQPRLGARYRIGDIGLGGQTTLRGGIGIFSGGDPSVIFANSFTNNGITLDDVTERDFAPGFTIDGYNPPAGATALLTAGDGEVNAIDPNFKIPTYLRGSLGMDHQFNNGWRLMLDYLYSKANNPLFVQDLTLIPSGTLPDGRPAYTQNRFTSDYLLTNGDGGRGHIVSASLSKNWKQYEGWLGLGGSITMAYSHQNVTEIQPLTSSRAVSNYGNFSKIDVNNPVAANANAARKHNALLRLNLNKDIIGDNTTSATFFFKYRSGQPYSFNYETTPFLGYNPFGDPRAFEDRVLLYVPTLNDPLVDYAPGFDLNAFNAFIAENGLEDYRGRILSRNMMRSDDYFDLDLRFSQELPGFLGSQDRFKLILDVENALNLIDSSWNTLSQVGFEYNQPVVQTRINSDGRYEYTNFLAPSEGRFATFPSVWQMQVGLTYSF